jgi:hypothetical protein
MLALVMLALIADVGGYLIELRRIRFSNSAGIGFSLFLVL